MLYMIHTFLMCLSKVWIRWCSLSWWLLTRHFLVFKERSITWTSPLLSPNIIWPLPLLHDVMLCDWKNCMDFSSFTIAFSKNWNFLHIFFVFFALDGVASVLPSFYIEHNWSSKPLPTWCLLSRRDIARVMCLIKNSKWTQSDRKIIVSIFNILETRSIRPFSFTKTLVEMEWILDWRTD